MTHDVLIGLDGRRAGWRNIRIGLLARGVGCRAM